MTTPEPDFRPVTMNTPGHIWSNVNFIFYLPSDSIYKKRFIYDHIQPLRGFQCRSDMKFHSMTPCKYRQNKYVRAGNERSGASLTRARIKSILNFQPLYSLSQLC